MLRRYDRKQVHILLYLKSNLSHRTLRRPVSNVTPTNCFEVVEIIDLGSKVTENTFDSHPVVRIKKITIYSIIFGFPLSYCLHCLELRSRSNFQIRSRFELNRPGRIIQNF